MHGRYAIDGASCRDGTREAWHSRQRRRIWTDRNGAKREKFKELREISDDSPHILAPLRRIGQPREIADAVLFSAAEAASFSTSMTLSVAGGR
jgi:NAD(P)-dependent dehydrogenase (short-subunit alcohol dehydrogenase family)